MAVSSDCETSRAIKGPTEPAQKGSFVGKGQRKRKQLKTDELNTNLKPAKFKREPTWQGAVEEVVTKCRFYLSNGSPADMSAAGRQAVARACQEMGSKGLRVVGVARGSDKDDMAFVGIIGLEDPLRPGVRDSVQTLLASKVQVCMITGDGRETAQEIARCLGILSRSEEEQDSSGQEEQSERSSFCPAASSSNKVMLSGFEVDAMSEGQLAEVADSVGVYYRVSPLHKLKIVKALQRGGHVVGMTGDGVNDGVAIKSADVGIAMGRAGTDVCKEAADVILLDDDFSTILSAIEEGKSIFYNIRNFVCFQLSTSIAALMLISLSTLLDVPNPLNPMQILWINVIMDGPPAQSLGLEPVDPTVLRKPPRKPHEHILTRSLMTNILISAFFITTGTMWVLKSTMEDGKVTARDTTMTFTTFVFFDMFNALSSRSQTRSVFEVGFLTNKVFCVAVGLSVIGQLLVIYFPPLQYIFQTEPLALSDLIFLVALSSSVFVASEVRKAYFNGTGGGQGQNAKLNNLRNAIDLNISNSPAFGAVLKKKGSEHMV